MKPTPHEMIVCMSHPSIGSSINWVMDELQQLVLLRSKAKTYKILWGGLTKSKMKLTPHEKIVHMSHPLVHPTIGSWMNINT
jgi:hypothetical protein